MKLLWFPVVWFMAECAVDAFGIHAGLGVFSFIVAICTKWLPKNTWRKSGGRGS